MRAFELVLDIKKNSAHRGHEIKYQALGNEKVFCSKQQASGKNKDSECEIGSHDTLA